MGLIAAIAIAFFAGAGAAWLAATRASLARDEASKAKLALEAERAKAELEAAAAKAGQIVRQAELEAREAAMTARQKFDDATAATRREVAELEKRVHAMEAKATQKDAELARRDQALAVLEKTSEEGRKKLAADLERIAGLTAVEARRELLQRVEDEARHDAAKTIALVEEEAKLESEKRAKKIIATAIQRWAGDHVSDTAITTVRIPSDDVKGRIIGREGRNIRAIEAATGVDIVIDDTPEVITVSAFNPIRREVARLAIEQLVADGRIHPGRIEECVRKAEEQIEKEIVKAGEQAIFDLALTNVHPEIVKLVGRLNYRYSYGQNQWKHALEVAFIAGAMAAELGVNEKLARRAGLLHDIGKTLVHDQEGSHALLGASAAKKYGEHAKIVHAIAAHHEEEKPETVLASITMAADALSGARPGARMEVMESYVKRLQDIETIATSFKGVEKTFAIQAGREVRVIVAAEQVSDSETVLLARDIAKKIETDLTYPGQIKVTVIRETRSSEFAR
jgi:ribonuclease Y